MKRFDPIKIAEFKLAGYWSDSDVNKAVSKNMLSLWEGEKIKALKGTEDLNKFKTELSVFNQ